MIQNVVERWRNRCSFFSWESSWRLPPEHKKDTSVLRTCYSLIYSYSGCIVALQSKPRERLFLQLRKTGVGVVLLAIPLASGIVSNLRRSCQVGEAWRKGSSPSPRLVRVLLAFTLPYTRAHARTRTSYRLLVMSHGPIRLTYSIYVYFSSPHHVAQYVKQSPAYRSSSSYRMVQYVELSFISVSYYCLWCSYGSFFGVRQLVW